MLTFLNINYFFKIYRKPNLHNTSFNAIFDFGFKE